MFHYISLAVDSRVTMTTHPGSMQNALCGSLDSIS